VSDSDIASARDRPFPILVWLEKENDMKKTTVNGVMYLCPTYLVRAGDGWQVRMPDEPTLFFSDGVYGGAEESFAEALRARSLKGPISGLSYPLADRERKNKKRPTGIPGVFLCEKHPKGKNVAEYQLQIRVPGIPIRTLYVGTTNTWGDRYQEKLSEAKRLHQQLTLQLLQPDSTGGGSPMVK